MNEPEHGPELFQLDRSSCLFLLATQHVGRIVVGGDDPYIVPVSFGFRDGEIVFRTSHGGRLDHAVEDEVTFEVDMIDGRTRSGWSVIVRGRLRARGDADVRSWAPDSRRRWLAITPAVVTGRLLRGATDDDLPVGGYL